MQTTVVISIQARDVDLPAGQPLVIMIHGSLQDVAVADADKTNHADKSTIDHEAAPPFWTWFVENPRPSCRVSP
jgi:hypothetical protein